MVKTGCYNDKSAAATTTTTAVNTPHYAAVLVASRDIAVCLDKGYNSLVYFYICVIQSHTRWRASRRVDGAIGLAFCPQQHWWCHPNWCGKVGEQIADFEKLHHLPLQPATSATNCCHPFWGYLIFLLNGDSACVVFSHMRFIFIFFRHDSEFFPEPLPFRVKRMRIHRSLS